jgi:hypothetical protein
LSDFADSGLDDVQYRFDERRCTCDLKKLG